MQLYTHQTLLQQGGTGEDGHVHLADWTLSVVAFKLSVALRPHAETIRIIRTYQDGHLDFLAVPELFREEEEEGVRYSAAGRL